MISITLYLLQKETQSADRSLKAQKRLPKNPSRSVTNERISNCADPDPLVAKILGQRCGKISHSLGHILKRNRIDILSNRGSCIVVGSPDNVISNRSSWKQTSSRGLEDIKTRSILGRQTSNQDAALLTASPPFVLLSVLVLVDIYFFYWSWSYRAPDHYKYYYWFSLRLFHAASLYGIARSLSSHIELDREEPRQHSKYKIMRRLSR
jgi:hypothetical protein